MSLEVRAVPSSWRICLEGVPQRRSVRSVISIGTAARSDLPAVLALWQTAATEPSATDDPAGLATLLARDPEALIVATDAGGIVVGAVIATWDGWRGSMYRLAVSPSHRRQRVATDLVAEGESRLRARGARRLHMIVASDQEPARRVLARFGV